MKVSIVELVFYALLGLIIGLVAGWILAFGGLLILEATGPAGQVNGWIVIELIFLGLAIFILQDLRKPRGFSPLLQSWLMVWMVFGIVSYFIEKTYVMTYHIHTLFPFFF